jgi:hypothetical protein
VGELPSPPPIIEEPAPPPIQKISKKERESLRKDIERNKRLERKEKRYIRQIKKNKPSFNTAALLKRFELLSKKSSRRLVKLVMTSLAMSNAAGYANEELQVTLAAEDVGLSEREIIHISTRMLRLQVIKYLGDTHKLPIGITDAIINLQISRDFGTVPVNTKAISPVNRPISQELPRVIKKQKATKFKNRPYVKKIKLGE